MDAVFKALAAKGLIHRMARVVKLDEYMFVVVAMASAAGTEHKTELRPVLASTGPMGEGHGRSVDPEQTAAAVDEFDETLPQPRVLKQISNGIVEEHSVELPKTIRLEYRGVATDYGLECTRLFAHHLKSQIGIEP